MLFFIIQILLYTIFSEKSSAFCEKNEKKKEKNKEAGETLGAPPRGLLPFPPYPAGTRLIKDARHHAFVGDGAEAADLRDSAAGLRFVQLVGRVGFEPQDRLIDGIMKETYQIPQAEEVRTDLVSAGYGNGLNGSWKDLIDEKNLVV